MSRPITDAERRMLVTGEKATHPRASDSARQRALDELFEEMTALMGVVERATQFRKGITEGDSLTRQQMGDRFKAFGGAR